MRSIVLVAGARPNFMKVAPLARELARRRLAFEIVHTGQHYDYEMSGVFFEQLGLSAPDAHLEIGSASHGVQTGRIMAAFDEHLAARAEPPRAVVVVGDVNSTMACALVAAKREIPVVHVEAGLRSFDRAMPEEINRVVTDAISNLLLASEPAALDNLAREGIPSARVRYVGNVMIDSLVDQLPAARVLAMPARLGLAVRHYAVATIHRPSNVDTADRLHAVATLLGRIAAQLPVVFPVHPRTERRLADLGSRERLANVMLCPPLGYREFLGLVADARVVVTDSGGIQEETTYLGVPCVTLRTSTERPVTTTKGTNVVVGEDFEAAARAVSEAVAGRVRRGEPIDGWDGKAAGRIVDALTSVA